MALKHSEQRLDEHVEAVYGPAAQAGIHVGDVIAAVDGHATAPYIWSNAATLITGGEGETVRLAVMPKE